MSYPRALSEGLIIRPTSQSDVQQLEQLQIIVFPSLADSLRLKAKHYLKHLELFPEGQFIAVSGEKVVGMTTSIRLSEDFLHSPHRFEDVIQGGYCTSHDNLGEWLYGVDLGVHPEFRGKGIARALYQARQETVHTFGLVGQYTMGMLSGYGELKEKISAEDYYRELISGKRRDPTISAQMKIGFEPQGLVANYLEDPICSNYCIRLVLRADKAI